MREKHPKAYAKLLEKEKEMDKTWIEAEKGEATLDKFLAALRAWSGHIKKAIQKKKEKNE